MKKIFAAVTVLAALSFGVSVNMSCSSGGTGGGSGGGSGGSTGGGTGGSTGGGSGGSTGGGSTAGGSGGSGGGSSSSCEIGSSTCNTLSTSGSYVVVMYSSATAPTPGGGTPVNGTYVMVSATVYVTDGGSGPTGDQAKHTLAFSSGVVQEAQERPLSDGGCFLEHQTGSVTFASPLVTYTQTCPTCTNGGNCGGMAGYTATATSFTLFNNDNGQQRVEVYNKQ